MKIVQWFGTSSLAVNMMKLALLCAVCSAIEFDENDPIASHPQMQSLINNIVDRNARRGLTNPATLSQQDRNDILAMHNKVRAETGYVCARYIFFVYTTLCFISYLRSHSICVIAEQLVVSTKDTGLCYLRPPI